MKKLVATAAVAAMLGSAAFADVNVGISGQNVWAIGNGENKAENADGNDVYMSNAVNWRNGGTRVQLSANASNEYFGVAGALNYNGTGDVEWDFARIWTTPVEQLKIWAGSTENQIRGDACYGTWDLYRVGTMEGAYHEGWTFQAQDVGYGSQIGVFPITGLKFFASFAYPRMSDFDVEKNNLANILGRHSNYAAAYTIGADEDGNGIATIKVGVAEKGKDAHNKDGEVKDQNILNFAVDATPMENLFISVGAFIPTVQYSFDETEGTTAGSVDIDVNGTNVTVDASDYAFNRINAYVKYGAAEGLNIHAQFGTKLNCPDIKKEKGDGQLGFLIAGGVDYAVMDDISVYGDVGYVNGVYRSYTSADKSDSVNFGVGVTKSFDAGSISAGFVGATNNFNPMYTTYDNAFSWGIPLRVSVGF